MPDRTSVPPQPRRHRFRLRPQPYPRSPGGLLQSGHLRAFKVAREGPCKPCLDLGCASVRSGTRHMRHRTAPTVVSSGADFGRFVQTEARQRGPAGASEGLPLLGCVNLGQPNRQRGCPFAAAGSQRVTVGDRQDGAEQEGNGSWHRESVLPPLEGEGGRGRDDHAAFPRVAGAPVATTVTAPRRTLGAMRLALNPTVEGHQLPPFGGNPARGFRRAHRAGRP